MRKYTITCNCGTKITTSFDGTRWNNEYTFKGNDIDICPDCTKSLRKVIEHSHNANTHKNIA